jgi:Flp pilus assembly pilin Flp
VWARKAWLTVFGVLRGASVIEYALLIALVSLIILGLIIAVGKWVNGLWANFVI